MLIKCEKCIFICYKKGVWNLVYMQYYAGIFVVKSWGRNIQKQIGQRSEFSGLIAGRNGLIAGRNKGDRDRNCTGMNFCRACGPQPPPLRAATKGYRNQWEAGRNLCIACGPQPRLLRAARSSDRIKRGVEYSLYSIAGRNMGLAGRNHSVQWAITVHCFGS